MIRYMILLFLLMTCLLPLSLKAGPQQKQLTAQNKADMFAAEEQVPLKESLRNLEEKFKVNILFKTLQVRNKYVSQKPALSGDITDELHQLLEPLNMAFEQVNGQNYIIFDKEKPILTKLVQELITGTVTDSQTGETLPGVNILLKGTTTGASTDADGNFELTVESLQDTLVVSFVGYQNQEVPIQGRTAINVALQPQTIRGEEMVVIGYGEQKREDLTGSISTVNSEEIQERSVSSIDEALQGKVPGLRVQTNSAAPGGGVNVQIRGNNSINSSSSPLYVVDGLPVEDISNIPPENIKSISVLKDASATAIYGTQGANGVILITTHKGQANDIIVSYNGRLTTEHIPGDLGLMNAEELATIYTEWEKAKNPDIESGQLFYNGSSYDRPLPSEAGEGTDWYDEISRSGFIQNHQLSVSGGSDMSTYLVALNFRGHKGLIKGGNYNRYGLQFNNSFNLTDWLDSGIQLYLSQEKEDGSGENTGLEGRSGVINPTIKMPPTAPIRNPQGGYQRNNFPGSQTLENPLAAAIEEVDRDQTFRARGNFFLNFKPLNNFSFETTGGFRIYKNNDLNYNPSTTIYGGLANGIANQNEFRYNYYISKNVAKYSNTFYGIHEVDATAGFTYQQQTNNNFGASARDFFTDKFLYNNLDAANTPNAPYSGKSKYQLASWLGRINYIYNDKYLLTLTGRYDGSSKFGEGNKWGFFPSIAAAWRIANESFMQEISNISNLKLRASYGATGNSRIGLYQSLGVLNPENYNFGYQIVPGVAVGSLPNNKLGWETTTTANIGVDVGLLNDRINFTIDAYQKKTSDLLLTVNLIGTSGFQSALRNVGKLENKGLEIGAGIDIIRNNDFLWNLSGNIAWNRNKITQLTGDPSQSWRIGQSSGAGRTFIFEGIINDQEELNNYTGPDGEPIGSAEVGDYKYRDLNGDGDLDGDDLTVTNNSNPDYTYGFTNYLSYKNFDLSLFITGVKGGDIYNAQANYLTNIRGGGFRNNLQSKLIGNYWTSDRKYNVEYPKLGHSSAGSSARLQEDGSYLRLQNVKLSYNFSHFTGSLKNATVYVSGQNLLLLTDYSGWDPDVTNGYDGAAYPRPRSFSLGINFSF